MPKLSKTSNSRVHWQMRAELRRAAHYEGSILARAALSGQPSPFDKSDRLRATVTFRPKTRVCPDLDNALSGIKGEIDGLFTVLGVDDKQIERMELARDYDAKTGDVEITVSLAA